MAISKRQIETTMVEMKRLNTAMEICLERMGVEGVDHFVVGTPETGAVRRRSLDLTRALAELRKP